MRLTQWLLLLAAGATGALVFGPQSAEAFTRRLSATTCFVDRLGYEDVEFTTLTGLFNQSRTVRLDLQCPVPDDDQFAKSAVTNIDVHGYDGNDTPNDDGRALAAVCVTYWGIRGGYCDVSAQTGTTSTGNFNLHPTLSPWSHALDFGYLFVRLPAQDVSAGILRGITVRN